jgi:glycosyltransferase involved in cell wall biosynthesis
MAIFIACAVILTSIVVIISFRLRRSLNMFRYFPKSMPNEPLPSVSVCIPARNEMHALASCLERVLASDYEKLEIIVFDDSSADDTSVLIRSFAHAGVRFIPGPALPDGWLGKNHALEVLADEASGAYLLFLDVDTFIQPNTISQLVAYALIEKADMLSVVPGRNDAWRPSVLFGHLRYFWQLILASRKHPKAAASLWMIKRNILIEKIKGFESFKDSVEPEIHIATLLGVPAYRCLVTTADLGVTYEKKWFSQVETSRRLLYPMFGHAPLKGLLGLLAMLFLNLPFAVVVYGVFSEWTIIQAAALWFILACMAIYAVYVNRFWPQGWWAGALLWPIVILQELILYILSLWGYARHTITWKGRSVNVAASKGDSLVIDK